jgi:hypothetical protein
MKKYIYAMTHYPFATLEKPRRTKKMISYLKQILFNNGFVNVNEIVIDDIVNIRGNWTLKIKFK